MLLAHLCLNCRCFQAYRVESKIVNLSRKAALPEHSGTRRHVRGACDEDRSSGANNKHSKTDASTGWYADSVTYNQAEKLSAKERGIICSESGQADLANDILEAVNGCSADAFGPHSKDKTDIVDPLVDTFQVEIAKACAVRK